MLRVEIVEGGNSWLELPPSTFNNLNPQQSQHYEAATFPENALCAFSHSYSPSMDR